MKINSLINNEIIPVPLSYYFFHSKHPTRNKQKETGNYVLTVQFASFIQILFPLPAPK